MNQLFKLKIKKNLFCVILAAGVLFLAALPVKILAQDTTKNTVTDSVPEEPEMLSPSLDFLSVQKGDNTVDLKARLRGKVNSQPFNFYQMKVTFYQEVNGEEKPLGFAITDAMGKATLNVKNDSLTPDEATGKLQFKASFAGNKAMEAVEETSEFTKARLEMTPVTEDSLKSVSVKLVDLTGGKETPVKDITVGIFIKRSFLPLKVAEGTTDENGEATIEIPQSIPGDQKGNLTLLAKVDEDETYGNLESSAIEQWGVPVSGKIDVNERALWSTHPPLWMLITFIVLMTAVWGHYIVIIYELFRLRKEEPKVAADATNL
jgi:hypothetical protein